MKIISRIKKMFRRETTEELKLRQYQDKVKHEEELRENLNSLILDVVWKTGIAKFILLITNQLPQTHYQSELLEDFDPLHNPSRHRFLQIIRNYRQTDYNPPERSEIR